MKSAVHLVHLRWKAVELKTKEVRVSHYEDHSPKSGRERIVPLVGEAVAVLERLLREGPRADDEFVLRGATGGKLGKDYVTSRLRHYRRMCGLSEQLKIHSLRHTYASWFVQDDGDIYVLKELMGHADIKTTMKYARLNPQALHRAVQAVEQNRATTADTEVSVLKNELARTKAELHEMRALFSQMSALAAS